MIKVSFIQEDLKKGGAERRISVLANELVEMGVDVEIVLYKNDEVAYVLNERIRIISPENLDSMSDRMRNTFLVIKGKLFSIFILFPVRFFAHMIRPLWKKPSKLYQKLNKKNNHKKYNAYNIRKYIKKNSDRVLISFISTNIINVTHALEGVKHGKLIFAEAADPLWNTEEYFCKERDSCYEKADICVFQTPGAKDCFSEKIRKKALVIPNPVMSDLPMQWKKERKKNIVNFCRLDPVKNLPLLINAFCIFEKKHPEYELYIYGDEPDYLLHLRHKEQLLCQIEECGLTSKVFIVPFQENIHEIIIDSAMYVSSSDHEGLSNAMLESMAMGLPVICTDCPSGGASFVINNMENGILVPTGNANMMADAMCYIAEHPADAERMGNNASKIREEFSSKAICEQWLKILS